MPTAQQKRSPPKDEGVHHHHHQGEDPPQPISENHGHDVPNNQVDEQVEEILVGGGEQVQETNNNHNNNNHNNGGVGLCVDDYEDDRLAKQEENGGQISSDDEENNNDNKEEFVLVRLSDIRKEVQCPICLGIIRKTRTVMECLHRFCRECIDKSMRMGNNECPACRTHCASRRSLRDDSNYDALIAAIYPNIDQFEEEELALQDDDRARNQEIQDSIALTFRRQTEALSKKRKRSVGTYRRRRNYRSEEEDDANGHDGGKETSSTDEHSTEAKYRRSKRWKGQPSPAGASSDGVGNGNDQEVQKDSVVSSAGLVGSSERLAWGKGGIRSSTRHGSASGGTGKHSRNRLARLTEHLRNLQDNDNELETQVVLYSLDQQKSPALHHPYLRGGPTLSVAQLCQYIALQTSLPPERVEILAAKGRSPFSSMQVPNSTEVDACTDDLQVLDSQETLAGLRDACNFAQGRLMLAYRLKQ